MKAACSRADLVRLLGVPGRDLLTPCASLLGFERQESPQSKIPEILPPRPGQRSVEPPTKRQPSEAPSQSALALYRVVKAVYQDVQVVEAVPLPWQDQPRGEVLGAPSPDPLVPWPRLWRHLRRHLSESRPTAEVDQAALVRCLSRAETIARVPRLHRARFASRPKLLVDTTSRQMPFWHDQHVVCGHLARWMASDAGAPLPLVDGDPVVHRLAVGWPDGPKPDFRGAMVLVVGDLGAYGGHRARQEWQEAAEFLLRQGATLRALVPCPFWRVDRKLAARWNAIPWEASERRSRPLTVAERERRAARLIELVSPAQRIELGLLRRARSLLPPDETDSGTEVDALFHPAVVGHSAVALTLDPSQKQVLEGRFDEAARKDAEGETRAKAFLQLLRSWHSRLPPEILVEEMFHISRRLSGLFTQPEIAALRARMEQFLLAIDSAEARRMLPVGVGAWFRDLERRLPRDMYADGVWGRAARRAYVAVHKQEALRKAPFDLGPEELQIIFRGTSLTPRRWRLWQVGGTLSLLPAEVSSGGGPPVPRIALGTINVGTPVAEVVAAEPLVRVALDGRQHEGQTLTREGPELRIPDPPGSLVLTTDCQTLHLESFEKPGWAKRGCDVFGQWAELEYKGVVQRMRWIAPGRFLMGSAGSEPERFDAETQHEVALTQGYWLADTACTQELWEAVMGKNPSRFQERAPGENSRPVERVSWDDCRKFLERMNEEVPRLALRFPTEAEWEYACRAGRTTPFSFGENITPAQVNYNGDYPYAGGKKGAYREGSVPVKSLPANAWGLYEMHGNVWEWCLDELAAYEPGRATDPCRNPEAKDVRDRVIRGGSWGNGARLVRSAYRLGYVPGSRYGNLGFRFARGRLDQPAWQVSAEGAIGPGEASGASPPQGTRATEAAWSPGDNTRSVPSGRPCPRCGGPSERCEFEDNYSNTHGDGSLTFAHACPDCGYSQSVTHRIGYDQETRGDWQCDFCGRDWLAIT